MHAVEVARASIKLSQISADVFGLHVMPQDGHLHINSQPAFKAVKVTEVGSDGFGTAASFAGEVGAEAIAVVHGVLSEVVSKMFLYTSVVTK